MRLFAALDIDDAIRGQIVRFVEGIQGFSPYARWVAAESLHVTLKFIGERPEDGLSDLKNALCTAAAEQINLHFRGFGFFPTAKAPRVFWLGIDSGPELAALAAKVDDATTTLGIAKETHAFSPHLTLARAGARSGSPRRLREDRPNQVFQKLQDKLAAMPTPDFGSMTAREFFLYRSQLSPMGSTYTKVAAFALQ